jgi:hypothetical protein
MQSEDRIIHFSAELVHAPGVIQKDALQRLYFELSQSRAGGYDSTDFTNMAAPRFYSRRGPKTQSVAVFLPDRLVLIEEWADMALTDFLDKVREIAPRVMRARAIPEFIAHTATIRSTFALSHYEDARVFLIDHACAQQDRITPHFKRPIAVGGLKFVLPETNEHPGALNVTIESFRHSRSEVFVEVKGIYGRERVAEEQLETVCANIRAVRNFISDNIFNYLNQYDAPRALPE